METALTPGLARSLSLTGASGPAAALLPNIGGVTGLPPGFATTFTACLVEWACIETLRPYLKEGMQSLGTHMSLSHIVPTAGGGPVEAFVELMEVRNHTLRFRVDCFDEYGMIGSGFHERVVTHAGRFARRLERRAA